MTPGHPASPLGEFIQSLPKAETHLHMEGACPFELLQNLDPQVGVTRADVYLHLGEIHEKLGEGPKAIGMYERGLELDPNHQGLLAAMGRVRG